MAHSSQSGNDVFDVRRVRRLVELMQENELSELDIQQGDMRIQLKRSAPFQAATAVPMPISVPAVVPASLPAPPTPVTPEAASAEEKNIFIIKSPMVGTFYTAPNPDAPAFVRVGDIISPEKTVCLIEAMKVYNEIQAECSGKIVAVLAKNGEPVEFGAPLFKVATSS